MSTETFPELSPTEAQQRTDDELAWSLAFSLASRIAHQKLPSWADHENVAAEVAYKTFTLARENRLPEPLDERTKYIARMSLNKTTDIYRAAARANTHSSGLGGDNLGIPEMTSTLGTVEEAAHAAADSFNTMLSTVPTLTEDQKQILTLVHGADLPLKQIAKQLGIAEGTVRTRLNRAHVRIKEVYPDAAALQEIIGS